MTSNSPPDDDHVTRWLASRSKPRPPAPLPLRLTAIPVVPEIVHRMRDPVRRKLAVEAVQEGGRLLAVVNLAVSTQGLLNRGGSITTGSQKEIAAELSWEPGFAQLLDALDTFADLSTNPAKPSVPAASDPAQDPCRSVHEAFRSALSRGVEWFLRVGLAGRNSYLDGLAWSALVPFRFDPSTRPPTWAPNETFSDILASNVVWILNDLLRDLGLNPKAVILLDTPERGRNDSQGEPAPSDATVHRPAEADHAHDQPAAPGSHLVTPRPAPRQRLRLEEKCLYLDDKVVELTDEERAYLEQLFLPAERSRYRSFAAIRKDVEALQSTKWTRMREELLGKIKKCFGLGDIIEQEPDAIRRNSDRVARRDKPKWGGTRLNPAYLDPSQH